MCGRYRLSRRKQLIQEYFDTTDEVDWEPRYNIAPSQSVGIIRQDRAKPERRFSLARWGVRGRNLLRVVFQGAQEQAQGYSRLHVKY